MFPIIDLNPNDETCIYSVLLFVIERSKKLGVTMPAITFDQFFWIKALEIITARKLNIVPLLGGFHLLMWFYGSIGSIMDESGISKLFECLYGRNTAKHMVTGKAVLRVNRAHLLTESALMMKLQKIALTRNYDENMSKKLNDSIKTLYKSALEKKEHEVDLQILELSSLKDFIAPTKNSLISKSHTACLWLQYMDYVKTGRNFTQAARTGNWDLPLGSMSKMLNLFAATSYLIYAKSAMIYLQLMLDLPNNHLWLHEKFFQGLSVVRRSNRYWAGLRPDLVIEQVMMRSIKSRGGLTRGSGFYGFSFFSVRTTWIYSMHAATSYHDVLSSLAKKCH